MEKKYKIIIAVSVSVFVIAGIVVGLIVLLPKKTTPKKDKKYVRIIDPKNSLAFNK